MVSDYRRSLTLIPHTYKSHKCTVTIQALFHIQGAGVRITPVYSAGVSLFKQQLNRRKRCIFFFYRMNIGK